MPEISLNILDVAENSIRAEASLVEITVSVQPEADMLTVIIKDDGCGMTPEQAVSVQDPFYTTRTTRKVGLGVPFFKQAAESTGGSFRIDSCLLYTSHRQRKHIFVRHFSADKNDTDNVQHFRGANHLRVAQPGHQDRTFPSICQYIAHHVRGKDEFRVQISQFLPCLVYTS